jgi:hypothetical protein
MNLLLRTLPVLFVLLLAFPAAAQDRGRDVLRQLEVEVIFASDGDIEAAGPRAKELDRSTIQQLKDQDLLRFKDYRLLGSDKKPVFRSYENWAEPISGSDEILCRFEVGTVVSKSSLRMDLELWLSRKKILKSGIALVDGKPVYVLGPEWRGGRLIIAMELLPKQSS